MFRFTLVVILKSVGAHSLPPGGGVRVGPLLRQFSDGKQLVQRQLAAQNRHSFARTPFMPSHCIQHWGIMKGTGPAILKGPVFLGRSLRRRLAMVHINCTKATIYLKMNLPHNKIQILNCVMGFFSEKTEENWFRQLTNNFLVHSNETLSRKSGHVEMNPVPHAFPTTLDQRGSDMTQRVYPS